MKQVYAVTCLKFYFCYVMSYKSWNMFFTVQEHEKFKTNKTRKLSASQKRKLKKLEVCSCACVRGY